MTVVTPSLADAITAAQMHARMAKASEDAAAESVVSAANIAEDIYHNLNYGILASDPGTRPDGTPSVDGDEYYNSVLRAKRMYVDGVWSTVALSVAANVMVAGANLSDVSSVSQARANLDLGSAALLDAGSANGAATLGADGKVPSTQIDIGAAGGLEAANNLNDVDDAATARTNLELGDAATKTVGAANGVAGLDSGGKVPTAQLPAGSASGVASLDANGFVPLVQMRAGVANGMAQLDAGGVVPLSQLPAVAGNPVTVSKSGDYVTISGDQGKVIWVTTGSSADVTITFVGAATAGDGATMIVAKADSGTKKVIVEDSDSTTQIAWLSNQYDTVCFRSNGSAWSRYWARISPRVDTYTSNDTWTKPPLAAQVYVDLQGAGGGGGSGQFDNGGSPLGGTGGGGGARATQWFRAAELSSTEAVTVPAGGAGGTGDTGNGNPGGSPSATTFGTTIKLQANGGVGGNGGGDSATGNGGSLWGVTAASNADGIAFEGAGVSSSAGAAGKNAVYGGASGARSSTSATAGAGGSSLFAAGAGGAGGGAASGTTVRAPGAGGKRNSYAAGGGAAAGSSGASPTAGSSGASLGVGGGGGGSTTSDGPNAGAGGNGGVGAGGGGGGGHGSGTGSAGSGGNGGRGEAVVTTVFA